MPPNPSLPLPLHLRVNGLDGVGLPADDPGFTLGLNAFETLRTYGDAPFRLAAHLDRLEASAASMGLPCPPRATLEADVEAACHPDAWVRITLTAAGNRVVEARPIDAARLQAPVRVAAVELEPLPWLAGSVKHGSRAAWVLGARALGAEELLLIDRQGAILEGSRSNVIAVVGGVLWFTPDDGRRLSGVTRRAMLDAAGDAHLPTRVGEFGLDAEPEELYLCSTLKELAPVAYLDDRPIGGGPVGRQLHEAFRRLVARECATTP